jgi:hypothetical protein
MPIITIRFPSDEEEERSKRFTVHRNYLGSIELFLAAVYGTGDAQAQALVAAQRALPAFGRIQRRPLAGNDELRRFLAISWASEVQLRLAGLTGDALIRYSNPWAAVKAYYAVYMSIHAWLCAIGMGGQIDDHTKTLRTVASQLIDRGLLPHPWNVTCTGCPELGERRINAIPAGANVNDHFESLASPTLEDFYPRLAKMLETTRGNRLQRNRREWLAQNRRKAMRAAEKRTLAGNLHATSVFDYLWRLRIRSNYGDVSAFLMSGLDDRTHGAFHSGLVTLTSATRLLIQSLMVARIGPEVYVDALAEFAEGGGVDLGEPVAFLRTRRAVLAPAIGSKPPRDH